MSTDIDVAQQVEAASLKQMESMDIEDVYTLMDVQLRERPGPRELYYRWERQNWSAGDIDLTQDKSDWQMLPEMLRNEIMGIFLAFFLGEAAVTDTLSPLVHAAPTDEDRQFLSTQLVDEARHTVFFERFFNEVIGMTFDDAKDMAKRYGLTHTMDYGYGKVFYVDLVSTTEALRVDPGDYGKFLDAVVEYHMLVEGMLALQGQRQILRGARAFNVVPGFRAGFTAVTRDESRHVNYGVWALSEGVKAGYHDRIVQFTSEHMNAIADVNTRSEVEIPIPGEEEMNLLEGMLPEGVNVDEFIGGGKFPIMQLKKRLKSAGISEDALQMLDDQWGARHEQNFDDYEAMFGKPHPIRIRRQMRAAARTNGG
jgi:ribonucleoside-diphosphate reductase beta chain